MIKLAMLAAAGLIVFTACGSESGTGQDVPSVQINHIEKVPIDGDTDIRIWTVTLSDGTVCVVSDGSQAGGITCDWSN